MPELRRLSYFLAVAAELNFSRAAAKLHVAQPALSRQIRLLEEELGVELLRRTTHAVELTEAGAFLVERGPALLLAADELWRGASSFGAGEHGSVVVAYGISSGYETAPRLLQALGERAPRLSIVTRVLPQAEILSGLVEGRIDTGIVRCPPAIDGLEAHLLRREPQGALLRRDRQATGVARLPDLKDEPVLLHHREGNAGHYDAVLELYRSEGLAPRILHRDLATDLTYLPIVEGRAIAIVGESVRESLPSALTWLPLSPPASFEISLLTRGGPHTPALARLLAAARETSAMLGWLQEVGSPGSS